MSRQLAQKVIDSAIERLALLHQVELQAIKVEKPPKGSSIDVLVNVDQGLSFHEFRYSLKYSSSSSVASILAAVDSLKRYQELDDQRSKVRPLVVVPYMGKTGSRRLLEQRISWFDLSGNAHIWEPLFVVHIDGLPNKFKKPGPIASAFSPKASRIAHCLLLEYPRFHSQRDIAALAMMDPGYTSKVFARLRASNFIESNDAGQVRARDPNLVLDAWHEVYDFSKHRIIKAHMPVRSSNELVAKVSSVLWEHLDSPSPATGLAAAWLLTRFADFRVASFYLRERLVSGQLEKMGMHEQERGANVWLIEPKDEGVFRQGLDVRNICLVNPIQVYLDLKGHPERSREAAEEIRRQLLQFNEQEPLSW